MMVAQQKAPIETIDYSPSAGIDSYRKGLEPMTFELACRFADIVHKSGLFKVTSPADALMRIMTGRELGLTSLASLRLVHIIEGKPALDASLQMALCMNHPDCEEFHFTETTTERATLRVKRRGRPAIDITWVIADAKRMGLIKTGGAWEKSPAQMLRARCKSDGAKLEFPDVINGLPSREELEEANEMTVRAQVMPVHSVQVSPYEALAKEMLSRVASVSTEDEKKALRADIKRLRDSKELPSPHIDDVIKAYSDRFQSKPKGEPRATPVPAEGQPEAAQPLEPQP